MMKPVFFAGLLILFRVSVLHAKDLTAYHLGEMAAESTAAPAFDVVNSETPKAPAVFRRYSTTNATAGKFLADFAGAQSNFIAAVQETFHQPVLDEKAIASSDFGYLITAFNIEHKEFPVTSELAASWARGEAGENTQSRLLDLLLQAAQRSARPDILEKNFASGETCRLVPASSSDEKLTLRDIERGELAASSSISTVSEVREFFRQKFSTGEQPLARALSRLLEPNCILDAELTQLAREQAAGQLTGRRDAIIDARTKAASNSSDRPVAVNGMNLVASEQPADSSSDDSIQPSPAAASGTGKRPVKIPGPVVWILAAVSVVSATASIVLLRKRRSNPSPVRAVKFSPQTPVMLQPELAPIVQAVKETFIQELALQRRELILAQQQAAAEIVELIRRLDKLQVPMQERLKTYEVEIQRLEKELAARTEENRELIKFRIELTRQQLESERLGLACAN